MKARISLMKAANIFAKANDEVFVRPLAGCGFSKFCHLFSLNSVTPWAVTPSSRVGWGVPPL